MPGQYQGRTKQPIVIGDKKGSRSTLRIGRDASMIERLQTITGVPLKIIHVMRHPLDNITTMITRSLKGKREPLRSDFERRIYKYFRNASINQDIREQKYLEILDVYHENFIENPAGELSRILDFLGLEQDSAYIEACAGIVYKKPHQSREDVDWPEDLKESVREKIKEFEFLHKYLNDDK